MVVHTFNPCTPEAEAGGLLQVDVMMIFEPLFGVFCNLSCLRVSISVKKHHDHRELGWLTVQRFGSLSSRWDRQTWYWRRT